ncbi:hypothetical protein FA10DRAFT_20587 [Acaromyces ingoldii]|uniref:Uncharacterized protein n=1 Tax=Acaromyces ingoldii TaxID=215250 RepID=A0A316YXB8_9BASI|nr:hypothetical protein FA10DRAFT_20587 [Acaromyces ingoldii]PWN93394.1 hypothetical protein FA10DRAFT_20587 [Acaromyces ingoldii]
MNVFFSLGVVPRPPGLGCAPPICLARHSGVSSAMTRNLCRGKKPIGKLARCHTQVTESILLWERYRRIEPFFSATTLRVRGPQIVHLSGRPCLSRVTPSPDEGPLEVGPNATPKASFCLRHLLIRSRVLSH